MKLVWFSVFEVPRRRGRGTHRNFKATTQGCHSGAGHHCSCATVIAAAKALFQQVEEPLTQATLDANRGGHYAQSAIAHRPAFGLGSHQRRFPSGTQKGTGSGWYRPSADAEPKPRLPPQL